MNTQRAVMNMPGLTQAQNIKSSNTLAALSGWKYYFEKWSGHIAMLSNHNPHCTCKRFHHQHSLPAEKRGEKKLYWSFSLFLPGIPISPCSLSSTSVDKSHICVPFWRLLIVLNRRNYSQDTAVLAKQKCRWQDCTQCHVKSCLLFHQPRISSSILLHLPIPNNATGYESCTRFTSVVASPILSLLPQCERW